MGQFLKPFTSKTAWPNEPKQAILVSDWSISKTSSSLHRLAK
jgi:hypothetical protein